MGIIQLTKLEKAMNGMIDLTIEVRTSVGPMLFHLSVADQGSASLNEREGFLELQKLLKESLDLVQHQLG